MTREIIKVFHLRFENKRSVLSFLSDEFGIKLPSHSSYSRLIEEITNQGKEEEFCQKVFGTKSFREAVTTYEIFQGLQAFSKEELIKIADRLSVGQNKWTFNSNTIKALTIDIVTHVSKEEMAKCLEELIKQKELPSIRQYKRWVIGPLGIIGSVITRKTFQSIGLIQLFDKYINRDNWFGLRKIVEDVPSEIVLKDDPLFLPKFFQLLLAYANDEKILKSMNRLIQDGKLKIEGNLRYWDFIATPCGLFKRRYRGVERLANILTHEFEEQELSTLLDEEGLVAATTKLRVLERCIKEKPSDILDEMFGLIDLWRIGKGIGLISPEKIKDKRELIDIILLRLGFSLPPKLEGLSLYEKALSEAIVQLQDPYIDQSKRNGIMIDIFAKTELILKDLIYFHMSFLWNKKIEKYYELNDKKSAADEIIRNEFVVEKNVDEMNLGPLINLLRQIKRLLKKDSRLRRQMSKVLGRETVLSGEEFKIMDKTSPFRPIFEHDIRVEGIRKYVSIDECRQIINELSRFTRYLREKQIYPQLIRITKEVTDEYGTTYVETVDERGEPGTIKPKSWIRSNVSYFMHSKTKPVAIHPFIVERFW